MKIGSKVTVERDEKKYPIRGTWREYRGRKGVVVTGLIGGDEYGVSFTKDTNTDAYFKKHELTERN